jgi:sulfur-oxidizing protein SoxA
MTKVTTSDRLWRIVALAVAVLVVGCTPSRVIPPAEIRSGTTFGADDLRAIAADEDANPATLWLERGTAIWHEAPNDGSGPTCQSCHGDVEASMHGVAAHYPQIDRASGSLLDLEARINDCRVRRQHAPAFRYESESLLAIVAYVARASRGVPIQVSIDGAARAHFDSGRSFYYSRRGQMNLACNNCHEQNWGRRLLGETISQGHPTGYPIYRLEWQSMGSEQHRLRACLFGVRAELLPYGNDQLVDLELFLAWRAQGLPIETPAVRR